MPAAIWRSNLVLGAKTRPDIAATRDLLADRVWNVLNSLFGQITQKSGRYIKRFMVRFYLRRRVFPMRTFQYGTLLLWARGLIGMIVARVQRPIFYPLEKGWKSLVSVYQCNATSKLLLGTCDQIHVQGFTTMCSVFDCYIYFSRRRTSFNHIVVSLNCVSELLNFAAQYLLTFKNEQPTVRPVLCCANGLFDSLLPHSCSNEIFNSGSIRSPQKHHAECTA